MNWYLKVLKQYADFSGRARRKEYWIFALFNLIFVYLSIILFKIFQFEGLSYVLINVVYFLAIIIPSIAVVVRRLHDVGKSGWMILISLIPIIGTIWLLVLMVTDSDAVENKYGQNPKDIQTDGFTEDELTSDKLILIVVILIFIDKAIRTYTYFYSTEFLVVLSKIRDLELLLIFTPIILAFAVKNKSKQIVLFILGAIYLIYSFYETIKYL